MTVANVHRARSNSVVNAGVSCQTCHGPVQEMNVVYQAQSLNMGWCVDCHIQNKARYDCAVCHH